MVIKRNRREALQYAFQMLYANDVLTKVMFNFQKDIFINLWIRPMRITL